MTAQRTGHWTDEPCIEGWGWRHPEGYKICRVNGRTRRVHMVAYEAAYGPVPPGLEIDHLCRNRACCNPKHLEAVTHRENLLRGEAPAAQNARRTHCIHGHPLTGDNIYGRKGKRQCKTCARQWALARYYRLKEARNAEKRVGEGQAAG